ncbi:MAG: sigma factor-like helix-turn-helix DNA-binding protein [Candidatus Heteroscillospira sp.]|jgi:RNA polymerase sigma factor (sigma-70 family)
MSATYDREAELEVIRTAFPGMSEDSRACRVIAGAMEYRLTPCQRQTLVLYYTRGMNLSQIARLRGVQPSTVLRTMRRAKQRLLWALRLGGIGIDD